MSLSEYKVVAGLAVSDMDRAREFYEGKLGSRWASTRATTWRIALRRAFARLPLAGARRQVEGDPGKLVRRRRWGVVDELTTKGVAFKVTTKGRSSRTKGIATFERDAKVAYFKDPDGNTLSIAQAPRSSVRSDAVRFSEVRYR